MNQITCPCENISLTKTENEWAAIVRRIGQRKLKDELASYKALMPKRDRPA